MASYKLSSEAELDIRRIYLFGLEHFGEAKADSYYQQLFARFEQIAQSPELYTSVEDIRLGYRRSVLGSNSIFYRIINDIVEIMAIIGMQDTDEWP